MEGKQQLLTMPASSPFRYRMFSGEGGLGARKYRLQVPTPGSALLGAAYTAAAVEEEAAAGEEIEEEQHDVTCAWGAAVACSSLPSCSRQTAANPVLQCTTVLSSAGRAAAASP